MLIDDQLIQAMQEKRESADVTIRDLNATLTQHKAEITRIIDQIDTQTRLWRGLNDALDGMTAMVVETGSNHA